MNDPRPATRPTSADASPGFRFAALPQRQSLVGTVVEQLARQIESGAAAPGSRLPAESELCRQFAVSRTVVREAVARLKADQLVETQPGLGLFVVRRAPGQGVLRLNPSEGSTAERARELLEFRAGLEAEAARLAALRRTDDDIAAIRAAFARIEETERAGGIGGVEDLALHMAIARAAKNAYIVQVLQFLSDSLRDSICQSRIVAQTRREHLQAARDEHARVVDAIIAGDPDAATLQMRVHLGNGERRLPRGAVPAPGSPGAPSPLPTTRRPR
jgi:GntR family transcriptional repressor for pyruvate dehydrogenase complex